MTPKSLESNCVCFLKSSILYLIFLRPVFNNPIFHAMILVLKHCMFFINMRDKVGIHVQSAVLVAVSTLNLQGTSGYSRDMIHLRIILQDVSYN